MPPFDGPRATLCVTRYPSKTCTEPSSIPTGIETTTAFLHSDRTLTRFESISKTSATRRSCSRAMSYGFSRRCETGASIVTCRSLSSRKRLFAREKRAEYTPLSDSERNRPACRGASGGRHSDDAELVGAAGERRSGGAAAGDPELEPSREDVAEPRQEGEADAARVPERDVEPLERLDLVAPGRVHDPPGRDGEDGGLGVGGAEALERERDRAQEVAARLPERDRPRDPERLVALGLDADRALRRRRPDRV